MLMETPLMLIIDPVYVVSGLAVGALVGLTGVGGGSLMTPLLVMLFGIPPATAVGTDLLYACATKGVGTVVHGFNRTIDWRVTARLAAGSVPAAAITLYALYVSDLAGPEITLLIKKIVGLAVLLTAISLVFRRQLQEWSAARAITSRSPINTVAWTIATGAVLGVLVSLSSIGAGAIGVTVLLALYPQLPTARIIGSDIAHAVPLTLLAGAGHWMIGSVDTALLASLLVGSIPGVIIGSQASGVVPERFLRPALAATLALVGGKMIV
jgi:uncharacterized protein